MQVDILEAFQTRMGDQREVLYWGSLQCVENSIL